MSNSLELDSLNSVKYLYLRELSEPRDNSLRLVVQEAGRGRDAASVSRGASRVGRNHEGGLANRILRGLQNLRVIVEALRRIFGHRRMCRVVWQI
jgi:hypothetical protein